MKAKIILLGLSLAAGVALGEGRMSEPAVVFAEPDSSILWMTAIGPSVTLPVDFPSGATSADLEVRGVRYVRRQTGITTSSCTVELPEATDARTENVYGLVLTFDTGAAVTGRLAVVRGTASGPSAEARCLSDDDPAWKTVDRQAVLPVPYGTTSLSVDGVVQETGLDGAAGWYCWKAVRGEHVLELASPVGVFSETLTGLLPGLVISVR